nr:hypothetical protein [Tanacetum cinerariifolium]
DRAETGNVHVRTRLRRPRSRVAGSPEQHEALDRPVVSAGA